jgi:hypothetical protein
MSLVDSMKFKKTYELTSSARAHYFLNACLIAGTLLLNKTHAWLIPISENCIAGISTSDTADNLEILACNAM